MSSTSSSQLNLLENEWGPSTSNTIEVPTTSNSATVMGFTSFLITTKTLTFITYLVLLIVSVKINNVLFSEILLDRPFFYTIVCFGVAEVLLIGLTILHIFRPTLGVVFCILGSELVLGGVKFVFAITLDLIDGGRDCWKEPCKIIQLTEAERFGLFWFCLISSFFDYLWALIIISHSPQMHNFELGEEYLF